MYSRVLLLLLLLPNTAAPDLDKLRGRNDTRVGGAERKTYGVRIASNLYAKVKGKVKGPMKARAAGLEVSRPSDSGDRYNSSIVLLHRTVSSVPFGEMITVERGRGMKKNYYRSKYVEIEFKMSWM